jgi:dTDP-4-amino-4,6-dideoxygalactose transaminase
MSNRVNYWTGEECRAFEREFAAWSGTSHAIALANGTLALDLALKGLGIGPGDEVIVTPRTFIASTSCVVNAGATPVFADVDADSGNISPATIKAVLTEKTKAVIPVHIAGWPADMPEIIALAKEHRLQVIEDCAQAHGALIDGKSVGGWGDVGAWSFCQDKIMSTGGEGGMVTTDNADLWSAMWSFKDHGKSWDAVYNRNHRPGFRWVHESIGTNWRMLEMQAVLGRIQLTRMSEWTARRTVIAKAIADALASFADAVRVPAPGDRFTHAYYRQYAYVRPDGLKSDWDRDRIVAEVNDRGVPLLHGTCSEVYLEKAFDGTGFRPAERLPVAHALGETSLMFLVHPTLTDEEVEKTCRVVTEVFSDASR